MKPDKNNAKLFLRMPRETEVQSYICDPVEKKEIKDWKNIFVFSPFDQNKHTALYFNLIERQNDPLNISSLDFENLLPYYSQRQNEPSLPFEDIVQKGIDQIKAGDYKKLVLSRKERLRKPIKFDFESFFKSLCETYAECFVYLLFQPGKMCWIGASPEVLASFDDNEFRTMALAGTKTVSQIDNGEKWGSKEIREQEYVSKFILDVIKETISETPNVNGPDNLKTGDLYHLKSDISVKASFKESFDLLNKLHPTPAVSGLPQEKAISYLSSSEGYDREYYSGYLGIGGASGGMNYFVNLRCTQVFKEYFEFYAGAGITEDSDPVQEYVETSRKISALKKLVHA